MGKLEKEIKSKIRASKVQKAVLQTIATAGLLSVSLLAPNTLKILKNFNSKNKSKNERHSINTSRRRLIEKGLIQYTEEGKLFLTSAGQKKLYEIERLDFKMEKPKKWDGKWRVLIFDIKENKRSVRNKIRITLNFIGFVRLQNSVWVYPYDCEDLINLLKADFGVGREVLYLIVDKIENDKVLKSNFRL
jgi:DNA-binding transcriptional regulator PaaX